MSQQPEPLSPEERAYLVEFARDMGPTTSRLILQCLAENESLAARVSSLEAERAGLANECVRLDELAQEVRRAWDAYASLMVLSQFTNLETAIDALVPPVAPPENTKEARK